jgi:hypothetical protein
MYFGLVTRHDFNWLFESVSVAMVSILSADDCVELNFLLSSGAFLSRSLEPERRFTILWAEDWLSRLLE